MRILNSNAAFEMSLPELRVGDRTLPAIVLPKRQYRDGEVYIRGPRQGMKPRPFVELTDDEVARLEAEDNAAKQVQAMMARGVYQWLDAIPESMKTSQDLIPELREEALKHKTDAEEKQRRIDALEAEIAALKSPQTETTAQTAIIDEKVSPPKTRKKKSGPVDSETKTDGE